ncbi:MAG TPA: SurA N-terminal domain-containing protein [Myxococcota bacterium]|nr:SurA N-terminal domain-containing protein [Myxococcota bacterium]HQK50218.1 SurA N-terminal domain-containing protein [Myxococcota bacterium]
MLAELRKQSRSVIIYVLFGIIIVVFVFTFNMSSVDVGCGGGGSRVSQSTLAQVGDQVVDGSLMAMALALSADPPPPAMGFDPRTFQAEMLYRTTRFFRLRGDDRYRLYQPDPRQVPDLKSRKVADDLFETLLVSQEAERLGLRATPEEIRTRILAEFTDPSTGQFRKKSYENYVRYSLRTSLGRFEEFVGREILREKMIDLVTAGVAVSDREARYLAARRQESRSYEFLEVDPQALAEALKPSPQETAAWLAAHEDRVKSYFEEHRAEFRQAEAYDFHLIRVSAPSRRVMGMVEDPDQRGNLEKARSEAQARAREIEKRIQGLSGDALVQAFADQARQFSDDAMTRERGGRVEAALPAQSVAALTDQSVAEALARLQPRTASGVLEGDNGFYLVLLQGIQPARDRPYEEVREEIAARLAAEERAQARMEEIATRMLEAAKKQPLAPLAEAATEVNAPFAPAHPVQLGETGAVPGLPTSLQGLVSANPKAIPGLGESEALVQAVQALTPEKPLADQVFTLDGGRRVVVRLKEAKAAGEPSAEEIEKARQEWLPVKRQGAWRAFVDGLRAKAAASGRLVEKDALQAMIRDEARAREEALMQRLRPSKKETPAAD